MGQLAHGPGFAPESRDQVFTQRELRMENLDRDRARHGGLRRPIHRAHATRADLVQDPKLAAENFSMQKWVGGSHASVLIAELARCDENPKAATRKAEAHGS